MFLKNAWYPVFWGEELVNGKLFHRKVLNEPILFFRQSDGSAAALFDVCPHRQVPLHLGRITPQGTVQCGYHGLEFEGSGKCVHNPHAGVIPVSLKTKSYPVVEKYSLIWIWMGEGLGDSCQIPDFGLMDARDDGLSRGRAYIHIAANYQLVADNLLDLSHANYLHDGILGLAEHSTAEIEVKQVDKTITCKRMMRDVPIARFHDLLYKRDSKNIDMWNVVRWDPPGSLILTHGFSRPGGQEPFEFQAVHLLTPETETSTHYCYGIARSTVNDEVSVQAEVAATRKHVFEEQDRLFLEAQQKIQDEYGPTLARQTLLSVDSASVRMRRTLNQMIAAQQVSIAA